MSELTEVLAALPQDEAITIERVRPHNKSEIRSAEQISPVELKRQLLLAHEEEHLPGGDWEVVISALGKRLIAHHDGVFWLEPLT
ncbi:hypothetical protein [Methylomagnum ishizawai]|uniref:hypothetical protein n=1 Tax=Methylomagnum ishizawai TaxID=1760988 RepID=UPI000F73D971|nr:hypothetical protein [Methylomagnum ishizawai]